MKKLINRKNKGFTLVEVLAVIAVLAITLLVSVPKIGNLLQLSREKTFKVNAGTITSEAKKLYQKNYAGSLSSKEVIYEIIDGKIISDNEQYDVLNGKIEGSGIVQINSDGEVDLILRNNEFCALKGYNDSEIQISSMEDIDSCGDAYVILGVVLNGGKTSQKFDKIYLSGKEILLELPTKENAYFNGWEVVSGNSKIENNKLTIGTENTIIYALWVNDSILTVRLNGGLSSQVFDEKYQTGTKIDLYDPTRTGYTFAGWEVTSGDGIVSGDSFTMGAEASVLEANWTLNTYTIAYDLAGGVKGTNAPTTGTYDNLVTIDTPTRTGYTFTGWTISGYESGALYGSADSSVTNEVTTEKITSVYFKNLRNTSGTVTLTANWRINSVYVNYDVDGGEIEPRTTSNAGTVYNWTTNSGIIYLNGKILSQKINYGSTANLNNYNNTKYINITKPQYIAVDNAEWICVSGCTTANRTFDQGVDYNASDFCDATKGDCTITVKVNWKLNVFTCSAGTYLAANATTCTTCPAGSACAGGSYVFNETTDQGIATCAAGTYNTTTGNATCTTCPAGSYCTGGTNKTACAAGTYRSGTGGTSSSSCTTCAAGTYNTTTGNTSCTTCPAGSYCTGGTNKTACAAGTYRSGTGGTAASSCATCAAGTYNTTTGNTSCTTCPAGSYCTGGTNKTACAAGTYRSGTGGTSSSSCTTCAAGTYTSTTGNTSCTTCPAGYYCTGGTNKTACAAGTYNTSTGGTSSSSCTTCPAGSYCTGGTNKTACPAGTYRSGTGGTAASSCATCPAGKYNTTTGNTSCTTCPAGSYCTGGTNKTACPAGKYNASTGGTAASSCTSCPAGKYNTTTGNTSCTTCPAGYYCTGGTNRTACAAGKYNASTGGTAASSCTSCVKGSYTSGTASTACTACGGGKTTSAAGQTSCNANCTNTSNVSTWKTATWSANTVSNSCTINACASGYTLVSGSCVKKGTATTVSIGATSGTHYCGTSKSSYKWVGEVASGQGVSTGPYGGVFKFTTPSSGVYTKAVVKITTGIFPTAGASKTFYAKITTSSSYSTSTSGCASVSVKPGSAVQINNYTGVQFTINQTLQPSTTYYLHLIGTSSGNPCYFSFTVNGTQSISVSLS